MSLKKRIRKDIDQKLERDTPEVSGFSKTPLTPKRTYRWAYPVLGGSFSLIVVGLAVFAFVLPLAQKGGNQAVLPSSTSDPSSGTSEAGWTTTSDAATSQTTGATSAPETTSNSDFAQGTHYFRLGEDACNNNAGESLSFSKVRLSGTSLTLTGTMTLKESVVAKQHPLRLALSAPFSWESAFQNSASSAYQKEVDLLADYGVAQGESYPLDENKTTADNPSLAFLGDGSAASLSGAFTVSFTLSSALSRAIKDTNLSDLALGFLSFVGSGDALKANVIGFSFGQVE
jgi:hypothetical protein